MLQVQDIASAGERYPRYHVFQECTPEQENQGLLQVIYEDGELKNKQTLTEIRASFDALI